MAMPVDISINDVIDNAIMFRYKLTFELEMRSKTQLWGIWLAILESYLAFGDSSV